MGELESDGHAAPDGARGLDQIHGLAVLADDGDVTLGQKIAQVDDRFHVAGEEAHARNGLTNKEIANHFCLSEQTVKNHLYRMKQKVGADDRLGIVQVCRTQGFML